MVSLKTVLERFQAAVELMRKGATTLEQISKVLAEVWHGADTAAKLENQVPDKAAAPQEIDTDSVSKLKQLKSEVTVRSASAPPSGTAAASVDWMSLLGPLIATVIDKLLEKFGNK